MKLLIDTHVLLWLAGDSKNLSTKVVDLILDEQNSLFLSFASIWEIQIKLQLGKLNIMKLLPELIQQQCQANDIQLLEVKLEHIYALNDLQNHHRDPFDRLLIAQTQTEDMTLVSADRIFALYDVNLFW
jgi:PIN domain nuclease of toxin-antitoxin system